MDKKAAAYVKFIPKDQPEVSKINSRRENDIENLIMHVIK
jgi:hypothetical protein